MGKNKPYVFAGTKPTDSTLVTKALFAKRLGQTKIEHNGWELPLNHWRIIKAAQACLTAMRVNFVHAK
ncbi:MAG: hypothetical protein NTX82_06655 [Candidatus Parcubacteria bacterium]|nr:hypothetical protein [Candidatus Parcubacteria bacterium]